MRAHALALPYDIQELIDHHIAASAIQAMFRAASYRHVYHCEWPNLRKLLVKCVTVEEFDELGYNSGVRREWRSEPASWMYSLRQDPLFPAIILKEVRYGLWS